MPWTPPVNPVPDTVITAAYAVTNILDPLRWLRLLTGNADPPGSAYALVSTSTAGAAWSKVTADVLATGAALGNLGYTPVNRAGDVGITGQLASTHGFSAGTTLAAVGNISTSAGSVSAAFDVVAGRNIGATGSVSAGTHLSAGGNISAVGNITTTSGTVTGGALVSNGNITAPAGNVTARELDLTNSTAGLSLRANGGIQATSLNVTTTGGITSSGNISAPGRTISAATLAATGAISANGALSGGSISTTGNITAATGILSALEATLNGSTAGVTVRAAGVVQAVGINATTGPYSGGSTAAGVPSFLGINVGSSGVESAGSYYVAGQQVYHPGNPPPSGGGGGTPIPSGLIAFIATGALPTGWSFYTAANGRVIVAAGTAGVTNPQTFTVGTSYGPDWAHAHTSNSFAVSVTGTVSVAGSATGGPSDATGASGTSLNGRFTAGGANALPDNHTHSLNGVSLAVSASGSNTLGGSATGSTTGAIWIPPSHALNAIRKD